jgi:hypothetical protein
MSSPFSLANVMGDPKGDFMDGFTDDVIDGDYPPLVHRGALHIEDILPCSKPGVTCTKHQNIFNHESLPLETYHCTTCNLPHPASSSLNVNLLYQPIPHLSSNLSPQSSSSR